MTDVAQLRVQAREIFEAGLKAADPFDAVKNNVTLDDDYLKIAERRYWLAGVRKIHVIGCGKATARMAQAIEDRLGDRISDGLIVVKYGHGLPLRRIKVIEAGHPIPDEAGTAAALRMVELVRTSSENDLILLLVSGGGSALFPYPRDGVTLAEKQRTSQVLLDSGATIQEINAVRKHISKVKGGGLARLAAPARLVSLILSDVIGDSLEVIASGITAPDPTTYADCLKIIRRHGLSERIPSAVARILEQGVKGQIDETPKPGDPAFDAVDNVIVANNQTALEAAQRRAVIFGYHAATLSSSIEGESRAAARSHVALIKKIAQSNKRPACIISGGETTVTVRGDGLGGRNQEFALAAAIEIDGIDGVVMLSAGTDGTDGPTDAAGAIIDGSTVQRGRLKGFEPAECLARNDSYHFLQATGDLLITGPTLTNVMDVQVMLVT